MSIRIAVLISGRHGRGSNMEAIARACADGRIDGEIVLVVGNYADSPALALAESLGLRALTIRSPRLDAVDGAEESYGARLAQALLDERVDLVCLAGYIRKLPRAVTTAFAGRVMNIHNGLLPSFGGKGMYGMNVHQAVLDYGAKISGCTVHFVDDAYDNGPIILQRVAPVDETDTAATLAARVLKLEHEAYPTAVALFAANRLRVEGRRVLTVEPTVH
ncbi:MAG: phosphoribosylglycinamide formyltransferase [Capsulimonadaceae bacterium]